MNGSKKEVFMHWKEHKFFPKSDFTPRIFRKSKYIQNRGLKSWLTPDGIVKSQTKGKKRRMRKKMSFRKKTLFEYVEDAINAA
jgi:hypothetical protein